MSEITNLDDFSDIVKGTRTVVNFARRNGCVPCQRLKPHYEAAAKVVPGTEFYSVMLDEVEDALLDYALDDLTIMSTPTVLLFVDGEVEGVVQSRTAPALITELT